jgi:exodeoxyribonuclease V alpha subunit
MKATLGLSPHGAARPPVEDPLLAWLGPVRERLDSEFAIDPEVAFLAWEVARWPAELTFEERAALALLVLSALVALRQGSTRLPLGADGETVRLDIAHRLLGPPSDLPGVDAARALAIADGLIDSGRAAAVVGSSGEFKPLIVAGRHLYLQKMHALEERFAGSLRARSTVHVPEWDEARAEQALDDVEARPVVQGGRAVSLSAEQADAVRAALRYPLAVISGGPGTGKTTVVVSILRALVRLGVGPSEIVLAAPTGKSAYRLGQAVRSGLDAIAEPSREDVALKEPGNPQTLHRLLGYNQSSGRFLYHENNRLAARVIVVDEASMIDLVLMERLVRSLCAESRLILLGDDHQLPSVEAGAVLRDLIAGRSALGARVVRLTESYRMRTDNPDGRNILTVSQAIDAGIVPEFAPERTGDGMVRLADGVADVSFHGVELVESRAELAGFLDRWHAEVVRGLPDFDALVSHTYVVAEAGAFGAEDCDRLRRVFDHFERARILCLTRVRPTGSDHVNKALHRRSLITRGLGFGSGLGAELIPGEPVMMQVNDYDRMIFNGDQGLILHVSDGGGRPPALMAVFPREAEFVPFPLETLRANLVHSYALTVHKAQGSEYEQVALILPDVDLPINSREILYTALTRSRRAVTILGTRGILTQGIARRVHRSSGVADLLRAGLESTNMKP